MMLAAVDERMNTEWRPIWTPEIEPELRWYVVMTKRRFEIHAHRLLREQGLESVFLLRIYMIRHARQSIERRAPYYPGYLFVGVEDDGAVAAINATPFVSTVIHGAGGPLELSPTIIARERAKGEPGTYDLAGAVIIDETGKPAEPERERYERGDLVRITEGPFQGFDGTIILDDGHEIRVEASLFGRKTPIVMHPSGVKPFHPVLRSLRK